MAMEIPRIDTKTVVGTEMAAGVSTEKRSVGVRPDNTSHKNMIGGNISVIPIRFKRLYSALVRRIFLLT